MAPTPVADRSEPAEPAALTRNSCFSLIARLPRHKNVPGSSMTRHLSVKLGEGEADQAFRR